MTGSGYSHEETGGEKVLNSLKHESIVLLCLFFPLTAYAHDKTTVYVDGYGASQAALQAACANIGGNFNGKSWNVTQKETTISWFKTAGECVIAQKPSAPGWNHNPQHHKHRRARDYEGVYDRDCAWMAARRSAGELENLHCDQDGYQKMLASCASGMSYVDKLYRCDSSEGDEEFCDRMGFSGTFSFRGLCERWGG